MQARSWAAAVSNSERGECSSLTRTALSSSSPGGSGGAMKNPYPNLLLYNSSSSPSGPAASAAPDSGRLRSASRQSSAPRQSQMTSAALNTTWTLQYGRHAAMPSAHRDDPQHVRKNSFAPSGESLLISSSVGNGGVFG